MQIQLGCATRSPPGTTKLYLRLGLLGRDAIGVGDNLCGSLIGRLSVRAKGEARCERPDNSILRARTFSRSGGTRRWEREARQEDGNRNRGADADESQVSWNEGSRRARVPTHCADVTERSGSKEMHFRRHVTRPGHVVAFRRLTLAARKHASRSGLIPRRFGAEKLLLNRSFDYARLLN